MVQEAYVSFEIAKLLKEKGFDELCCSLYYPNGKLSISLFSSNNTMWENSHTDIGVISSPTHQMAMAWLREVHKIVLDITFETNKEWTFYVSHLITKTLSDGSTYIVNIQHSVWSDDVQQPYYREYEQAVEAALKYALDNLL